MPEIEKGGNKKWTFELFSIIIRDGMRKKIVLISLIVNLFFFGVICYRTWIAAFVVTKLLSGQTDGKQGIIKSIIIPWWNYELHLHHWFLVLIIGVIFTVKRFYILPPEVFYGSLSAIIFQGIYCYEDWYRIIKRKNALPTWAQRMPELDAAVGIREEQC
jgi:hypothetical protein